MGEVGNIISFCGTKMQSGKGKGQRFVPLYPPIMQQAVEEKEEEKGEDIKVAIVDMGGVKRGVLIKPGVPIRAPAVYPDPPTEPKCGGVPPYPNLPEGGKKVKRGNQETKGKEEDCSKQSNTKEEQESQMEEDHPEQEVYRAGTKSLARKVTGKGGFYFFEENPFAMGGEEMMGLGGGSAFPKKKKEEEESKGNKVEGKMGKGNDLVHVKGKDKGTTGGEKQADMEKTKEAIDQRGKEVAKQLKDGLEGMEGSKGVSEYEDEMEVFEYNLELDDSDF